MNFVSAAAPETAPSFGRDPQRQRRRSRLQRLRPESPDSHSANARTMSAIPYPRTAAFTLLLLALLVTFGSVTPVPYVIEKPGPAVDVLGEYQDHDVLSVVGTDTYETSGELMLTTVSVSGGPGYPVTAFEVITAWFNPARTVMPREYFFPPGQSREETALNNTVAMSTSQQTAVAVALQELDVEITPMVFIAGVLEGAPADGILKTGDILRRINGEEASDAPGFQRLAAATPEGQDVQIVVDRAGTEVELSVPAERVDGYARMGISLAYGYEFPWDVNLAVGDVGGPSAGMIFALAVYDELTPGALTGGYSIAGTGTIDEAGTVGPIGGIRQKMIGAEESGAEFFLAPTTNCADVVGHVPDDLEVVAVGTFDDAIAAVETIAETGSTAGLPTCEDQ